MVIKFERFAFTFRYQYVSLDWLRFHFFVSVIFISASLFINLFVLHGQFFFPPPLFFVIRLNVLQACTFVVATYRFTIVEGSL